MQRENRTRTRPKNFGESHTKGIIVQVPENEIRRRRRDMRAVAPHGDETGDPRGCEGVRNAL